MGLISGKFGNLPFHGSGCLIDSRVVLTCAHNLYDEEGDPTNLKFSPSINGDRGRSYRVKKFYYPSEYKFANDKEKSKFDFGVMELEEDLSVKYGYLGIDTNTDNAKKR